VEIDAAAQQLDLVDLALAEVLTAMILGGCPPWLV
jgi:hypothetical protein